jgi:hypothetical protein
MAAVGLVHQHQYVLVGVERWEGLGLVWGLRDDVLGLNVFHPICVLVFRVFLIRLDQLASLLLDHRNNDVLSWAA